MANKVAKYFLTIGTYTAEVYPLNESELTVSIKREPPFRNYVRAISKAVLFNGDAYDKILAMAETDGATFDINLYTSNYGATYARAKFKKFHCEFDEDSGTVKVSMQPSEGLLTKITDDWEIEYNILEIPDKVAIKSGWQSRLEIDMVVDTENPPVIGAGWEVLLSEPYETSANQIGNTFTYVYAREAAEVPYNQNGWEQVGSQFYRPWSFAFPNLLLNVTVDPIIPPTGWSEIIGIPVSISEIKPLYANDSYIEENLGSTLISNGVRLRDVFYFLLWKIQSELEVYSTFLFNSPRADGTLYSTYNYVTSDVLGMPTENKLNNLVLHQATDVKRPYATEKATIAKLSLKKLIDDLKTFFDEIYIEIDENGDFRLEHGLYYSNTVGLNLSTILNPKTGKPYVFKKNKYTYSDNDMPRFLETEQLWSGGNAFKGQPIELTVYSDKQLKKTSPVERLIADISGVAGKPESAPDEALTISACDEANTVYFAQNMLTGVDEMNGHLATPNLQYYYHRYNKTSPELIINGNSLPAKSRAKIKKQIELVIPFTPLFNENRLQTTELGNGEVESAELDLKTGELKLKLIYE